MLNAVYANDIEATMLLLNAGPDLSVKTKKDESALDLAIETKNGEMIKLLKSRGAVE